MAARFTRSACAIVLGSMIAGAALVGCPDLDALQRGDGATPPSDGGDRCEDPCEEQVVPDADAADDGGEVGSFDLVVVGAGPAGIAAALQASSMGRSVALLEATGQVGGQLLAEPCMEDAPLLREDGLYKELLARIAVVYETQTPPKSMATCRLDVDSRAFEPGVAERVLRQWLAERSVTGSPELRLSTRTRVASVDFDGARVAGVTTDDGTRYRARYVIDATEYGDLLPLAGVAHRVGTGVWQPDGESGLDSACVQDVVYPVTLRAYANFAAIPPGLDLRGDPPGDDYALVHEHFAALVVPPGQDVTHGALSPLPWDFETHNAIRGIPDGVGESYTSVMLDLISKATASLANDYPSPASGGSPVRLTARDVLDPERRAEHECRARLRTLQFVHYAQTSGESWAVSDELASSEGGPPACDPSIVPAALEPAARLFPHAPLVREGRRAIGVDTVTGLQTKRDGDPTMPDYANASREHFPTAMTVAFHAPSLRGCSDDSTLEGGLDRSGAGDAGVSQNTGPFQIPFGSFVPKTVDGLLLAEKNLSMSRLVASIARMPATSMASGQVAATIASMAIARGQEARAVPPLLVQRQLLEGGLSVSLHRFTDVPRTHARWRDVQLLATHGALVHDEGTFQLQPAALYTRAEIAHMFQRAFRYPVAPVPTNATFDDVPTNHPRFSAIEAFTREGISLGCSSVDGGVQFCPNDFVTRAQLALFLVRAMGIEGTLLGGGCEVPYDDVALSSGFCEHVAFLKSQGYPLECSPGSFCPTAFVDRADTVGWLARALADTVAGSGTRGECYRTPPTYCPKD